MPVALKERELALPRLVIAERVGNLLENQHDADAGEHPFDDARREVVGDDAGLHIGGADLNHSADDDGQKIGLEAERLNAGVDHHGEPGRRAADAVARLTHQSDDDAARDPRDETTEQRCPGRQRDTETQRQSHQKYDDPGAQVVGQVLPVQHHSVVWDLVGQLQGTRVVVSQRVRSISARATASM